MTGLGRAVPQSLTQQELWDGFFSSHYGNSRLARMIFRHSGVESRHGVINPVEEDISELSTAHRMARYTEAGLPLAAEAVSEALARAGLDPAEVGHLTVTTCTGYAAPGVDVLVAEELGMDTDLERVTLGHMGCYAALPALSTASNAVRVHGKPAVVLCLELTSLHLQPREENQDREQIVSHALFGDAAAALVLEPSSTLSKDSPFKEAGGYRRDSAVDSGRTGTALEITDSTVFTDTSGLPEMSWHVTDHGFRMGLSPQVPRFLGKHVGSVVEGLLERNGMSTEDVTAWAIHPGGPEIIDVVADKLGLSEKAISASRQTLANFGNCSSATVPIILDRVLETTALCEGDSVVAIAFGPGLTLHAMLLRA